MPQTVYRFAIIDDGHVYARELKKNLACACWGSPPGRHRAGNAGTGTEVQLYASLPSWLTATERERVQTDVLFVRLLPRKHGPGLAEGNRRERFSPGAYQKLGAPVVVLTPVDTDAATMLCLREGAVGAVDASDIAGIIQLIEAVMNGGTVLTPSVALRLVRTFQTSHPELSRRIPVPLEMVSTSGSRLVPFDLLALNMRAQGMTDKEIALHLRTDILAVRRAYRITCESLFGDRRIRSTASFNRISY